MSESESGINFSMPLPPSIEEVLRPFVAAETMNGATNWTELRDALVEREEYVADVLRVAGQSFGVLPQIMAEVFASIGLGMPLSTEQRALIHSQFHRTIAIIQAGGDPFAPPDINN